jgi:molybdopterin-binding protein
MAGVGFDVDGLEVRRAGRLVLRVPSLAIVAGETLAILGPNGAGKSTLLSILAGLQAPTTGSARIGGDSAKLLSARRRVSLLPQDAPLLLGTVEGNVARPLALRGVSGPDRRRRTAAMLERMGLSSLGARHSARLSGGEARRVALARALVTEPEALLLDEPFNGIDDPSRERLVADIRDAVRASGRTLVLVTQRRDEALRLATRLAVIWEGEIKQSGPTEQVLARPADPAIARFLGLENVLKGRVTSRMLDGIVVDVHGVGLHAAFASSASIGPEAWIVFGPEQVELRALDDTSQGSPRNLLPAKVVSVVPREGRVEISLDAGFPVVAVVTRAAVEELGLTPGVRVRAVLKATALHVIPA